MLKIITSLILVSSLCSAQDPKAIELINTAQKYTQQMSAEVTDPLCNDCSKEKLFTGCVQSLCYDLSKPYMSYSNAVPYQGGGLEFGGGDPFKMEEVSKLRATLEPKIKQLLTAELNSAITAFKDKKSFSEKNLFPTDGETIKVNALNDFLEFDEKDLINIPPELHAAVREVIEVRDNALDLNIKYLAEDPAKYFKDKYPNITIQKAVNLEIIEIKNAEKVFLSHPLIKNNSAIKSAIGKIDDLSVYQNIKSGKDFQTHDLKDLLIATGVMRAYTQIFNDPRTLSILSKMDSKKIKELSQSSLIKSKIDEVYKDLTYIKSNPAQFDQFINYCVNSIISGQSELATQEDENILKSLSAAAVNNFFKNVVSRLSGESKEKLQQESKNWFFTLQNKADYEKELNRSIKNSIENIESQRKMYLSLSEKDKIGHQSDYLSLAMYPSDPDKNTSFILDKVLEDYNDVCIESVPRQYSDHAISALGKIGVSLVVVRKFGYGKSVLAHELGHILFNQLKNNKLSKESSAKFKEITTCLEKKHGSTQYLNEDFADLMSAVSEPTVGFHLGCDRPTAEQDSLKEPADDDHSSYFFRMLHVEKARKNSIPPICEKYISITNSKNNFDSCWPAAK